MSEEKSIRRLREGYQPRKEELRGYQVSQPVDLNNLQIPTNLGTAAVSPQNSDRQVPSSTEHEKD